MMCYRSITTEIRLSSHHARSGWSARGRELRHSCAFVLTTARCLCRPMVSDYTPKTTSLPVWLDFFIYGPPAVRDSSPGMMALIFGRTDHDRTTAKKTWLRRAFNMLCLVAMYIFFLYVPMHVIINDGVLRHLRSSSLSATPVNCAQRPFFRSCEVGCERLNGLLDKCAPSR